MLKQHPLDSQTMDKQQVLVGLNEAHSLPGHTSRSSLGDDISGTSHDLVARTYGDIGLSSWRL
jgi:hypothetical protein